MSDVTRIDTVQNGVDLLITEWRDKPVVIGLLKAYLAAIDQIEKSSIQLLEDRALDTAVGVHLDNLGLIIGQPRYVENGSYAEYFGFEGQPNAVTFGAGEFYEVGEAIYESKELDDELYRLYLKARAGSNAAFGTATDLSNFFKNLFGADTQTVVTDNKGWNSDEPAHAEVLVMHRFTDEEKLIVIADKANKFIPRLAGVSLTITDAEDTGYFGFRDDSIAQGFNVGGFTRTIGTV